jgi:hypothetical protein
MQELRLVAVSEDGTYLVLATAGRGTRFTLPVDDRLRAAVRGHFSRLGQFEIEVESPLRPKEIQARIRSGETAEEIAESAGIPVERVRWFEGPVLQEREYMAQQAQRVTVRRPGESTPGPPLGETVEERLGRGGVDLEEAEWDSWKCEDSTWRIRLSFFDNGRPHAAEWVFDPRRRHVSPLDEVAARLTAVEWDDDALGDTVTPLLPRRPAMKIVSDKHDAAPSPEAAGRPERFTETPRQEPLRAADPVAEHGDLGRGGEPRSQPAISGEPPVASRPIRRHVQEAVPEPEERRAPAPIPKPAPAVAEEPAVPEERTPAQAEPDQPKLEPEPEEAAVDEPPEEATEQEELPEPETALVQEPETPEAETAEEKAASEEPSPPAKPEPEPKPEPAARQKAQPAAKPQRPAQRETSRPPAKKKPTGRPSMPPAPAADKPASPPAAAAAASSPAGPSEPSSRPARNRRKSKGKRASVPSWDEIMFGARRPE